MRIYRVEHTTKFFDGYYVGPFLETTGMNAYITSAIIGENPHNHPSPRIDGIKNHKDGRDLSAVIDIDDVLFWFPDICGRKAMHDAGFILRVYEIDYLPKTRRGDHQISVNKNKIGEHTLVEEILLTDIEDVLYRF